MPQHFKTKQVMSHPFPQSFDVISEEIPISVASTLLYPTSLEKEKKNDDDASLENDLVNGALLGLVSLASSAAPNPKSIATNEISKSTGKCKTQTPPPIIEQIGTITPSTSIMNTQLKNSLSSGTSTPTSIPDVSRTRSTSYTSDGSDPADAKGTQEKTVSQYENSTKHRNVSLNPVMPPKHPLSHSSMTERPLIPVPTLERNHIDSETRYTLRMKRGTQQDHFESQVGYPTDPRYAAHDTLEQYSDALQARLGPGPSRRYSYPNQPCGRQGFHDHRRHTAPLSFLGPPKTRPLPHYPMRRPHEPVQYRPKVSGLYRNVRNPVDFHDPYEATHPHADIIVDRQYVPAKLLYPPSCEYLPPQRRQYHVPAVLKSLQPIPRRNSAAKQLHHVDMNRSHDVRPQFRCPDSPFYHPSPGPNHIAKLSPAPIHSNLPYHLSPYKNQEHNEAHYPVMNTQKTILRRKCAWKNYPELEQFLIENREEYLKHSAKNYTSEQKAYNNRLTERLLELAAKHNYIFDPKDFNFVTIRDRIRCYYKSYVQSNKKRGVIVGYDATGVKKRQKCGEVEGTPVEREGNNISEAK